MRYLTLKILWSTIWIHWAQKLKGYLGRKLFTCSVYSFIKGAPEVLKKSNKKNLVDIKHINFCSHSIAIFQLKEHRLFTKIREIHMLDKLFMNSPQCRSSFLPYFGGLLVSFREAQKLWGTRITGCNLKCIVFVEP